MRTLWLTAVLALCSCWSTVFSRLPADQLQPLPGGSYSLSGAVTACGLQFPAQTTLEFQQSPQEGLRRAILGAPTLVFGHTLGKGTELFFYSVPQKLLGGEECTVVAIVLADQQTFGPNTFGPGDSFGKFQGSTPMSATLASARVIGGVSHAAGDQLELNADGQVTGFSTREARHEADGRANAHQKEVDDQRRRCSERCAPFSGAQRGDCINNCLYH